MVKKIIVWFPPVLMEGLERVIPHPYFEENSD